MYKYSQRLPWEIPSNAIAQLVQAKRLAAVPLVDLTVSNPTTAFNDYPNAAIQETYGDLNDFTYDPAPLGHEQARSAIAELYERRGVSISPDRLVLTASTSEAYALLFKMFGDPQSEILAPRPSYPLFEYLAALESVRVVPYHLVYDGAWFVDFQDLLAKINASTCAIVIVNPNNPTGSFLKCHEAEELFRIARDHQLPIISDEVFFDYSIGEATNRVKTLSGAEVPLSFSLDGLSKTAGMPQMKLGWVVINGPEEQAQVARERLELLLDTYLSVSTPVQRAAPRLLQIGGEFQRVIMERTTRNLRRLQERLQGSAAHSLHVEGGWSAIIQLPRTLSEESWVTRLLEEEDVLVQPGYFFDMASEAYIVVSLITPLEDFDEGISRLRSLANSV